MERITHELVQKSAAWLIHRATHDNASDAAAMLGCSPYKTRNQLLHERWQGMQPEFSQYVQERILDAGNESEKLARPLAEAILGEDLFPVTMSLGTISASMDGHTFDGMHNWEHKSLNTALLAVMPNEFNPGSDLPKHYRVQMEHQFIASGAEDCLFTASKWNGTDLLDIRHAWYFPDYELRAEIVAGWEQFHRDLAVYQPPEAEKPKPAGKRLDQLPVLSVTVEGRLVESNLNAWKEHALEVIASVNRSLVTDEDFATAENMVKWCGTVETACDTATSYIRSQVGTIDAALKAVEDVKAEAAKVRIELKNLGDRRKKERKDELVSEAVAAFHTHTSSLNDQLAPYCLPPISADFAAQVKGKSKFANMKNDLDTELARAKIAANEIAQTMQKNIAAINAKPEFLGLFADAGTLVRQAPDHVALVIRTRIADHEAEVKRKAEEAARAAEEKIRADERARIEAEERERRAQAERDEQERIRQAEAAARQEREDAEREKRRQDDESKREREQAEADFHQLGQQGAPVASPAIERDPDMDGMNPAPSGAHAESIYSVGLSVAEQPAGTGRIAPEYSGVTCAPDPDASPEMAWVNLSKMNEAFGFRPDSKLIVETLGVKPARTEHGINFWTPSQFEKIKRLLSAHVLRAVPIPF